MEGRLLCTETAERFMRHLVEEEKSEATIQKYVRDVKTFIRYICGRKATKEDVISYKQHLIDKEYAVSSINSVIASLNCLFSWLGYEELKVRAMKVQKQIFCPEEKELTREEYERLCRTATAKHNERLCLILQTICSTGIRVSELPFITAEAVRDGKTEVSLKGKIRTVFLPKKLQKKLLHYMAVRRIAEGSVFITKNGRPVNRSNIWREMKKLCGEAQVDPRKVFPHNLRHLFARIFYGLDKDIVRLADMLGHSSINTTRIYIISTGSEHRNRMEQMGLVL